MMHGLMSTFQDGTRKSQRHHEVNMHLQFIRRRNGTTRARLLTLANVIQSHILSKTTDVRVVMCQNKAKLNTIRFATSHDIELRD